MRKLESAYRVWTFRRLCLIGLAGAATAALSALHVLRLAADPAGAAVHAVALLITAFITGILGYLLACHVSGPRGAKSPWKRGARQAARREAPFVALAGAAIAAFLALATPALAPEGRAPASTALALHALDSEPRRMPEPLGLVESPRPLARASERPEPPALVEPAEPRGAAHFQDEAPPPPRPLPDKPREDSAPPAEWLERPAFGKSFPPSSIPFALERELDLERRFPRLGVPSQFRPEELPPVEAGASLYFGMLGGYLSMRFVGETRPFELNVGDVLGGDTLERGGELLLEFPLSRRDAFRVSFVGMRLRQGGTVGDDADFSANASLAGAAYDFTFTWTHLFAGFSHKMAGFTRESRFDCALHLGAMVDYTYGRLKVDGAQLAEMQDGERGWSAPAVGLTVGIWTFSPGGLTIEVLQSVPANIGGQTAQLTDVRIGMKLDLSERVSANFGYRRIYAKYRTFEDQVLRQRAQTHADFDAAGPVVGLDVRL
ncbi:MAG: hypothetical protein HY716_00115 [Planctomycetes bacterium]|nr:hypothetical protein [Planctomycetota bacterium]